MYSVFASGVIPLWVGSTWWGLSHKARNSLESALPAKCVVTPSSFEGKLRRFVQHWIALNMWPTSLIDKWLPGPLNIGYNSCYYHSPAPARIFMDRLPGSSPKGKGIVTSKLHIELNLLLLFHQFNLHLHVLYDFSSIQLPLTRSADTV